MESRGTKRGRETVKESELKREREREKGGVKRASQRAENGNRVKETAETSPDASLHTLSGSITHANPRGETKPTQNTQYKKRHMPISTSIA